MIKSPAALKVSISTGPVSTRVAAAVTGSTAQSTGGVSTEAARIKISTDIEREERERGGGRRLAGQALESSAGGIRLCQGQSPRNQDLKIQQAMFLPVALDFLATAWPILSEIWEKIGSILMGS